MTVVNSQQRKSLLIRPTLGAQIILGGNLEAAFALIALHISHGQPSTYVTWIAVCASKKSAAFLRIFRL